MASIHSCPRTGGWRRRRTITPMKSIRLRDGKERSLLRRHPWVFEGSIDKGGADSGETVRVQAHDGRFLAWGAYSPRSTIRVRAWSFDEAERIDAAFFERRLAAAIALRARLADRQRRRAPGARRSRWPAGADRRPLRRRAERAVPVGRHRTLARRDRRRAAAPSPACRACTSAATPACAPSKGWRRAPAGCAASGATEVAIREHDWTLALDVADGHKTGFYLDQRDNRQLFAQWVRQLGCRRVLNCYCYTGGFTHRGAGRRRDRWW